MNLAFGRCRDINGPLMEAALALYRSSFPLTSCVSRRISAT